MLDVESATHLRGVVSRIARRLNASATSEGLTPTQASVLGLIAARGPLGQVRGAGLPPSAHPDQARCAARASTRARPPVGQRELAEHVSRRSLGPSESD